MTLILRGTKGSKLTIAEMDNNLSYLEETAISASYDPGYWVYRAQITQTDTQDPIIQTVYKNTIGDISFSRMDVGTYIVSSSASWNQIDTIITQPPSGLKFINIGSTVYNWSLVMDASNLAILTTEDAIASTPIDGKLNGLIEIRVYATSSTVGLTMPSPTPLPPPGDREPGGLP